MRKKFTGPANPGPDGKDLGHDIVIGGFTFHVKRNEVLEIPAETWKQIEADCKQHDVPLPVWSEELWADVKTSKKDGDE